MHQWRVYRYDGSDTTCYSCASKCRVSSTAAVRKQSGSYEWKWNWNETLKQIPEKAWLECQSSLINGCTASQASSYSKQTDLINDQLPASWINMMLKTTSEMFIHFALPWALLYLWDLIDASVPDTWHNESFWLLMVPFWQLCNDAKVSQ